MNGFTYFCHVCRRENYVDLRTEVLQGEVVEGDTFEFSCDTCGSCNQLELLVTPPQ